MTQRKRKLTSLKRLQGTGGLDSVAMQRMQGRSRNLQLLMDAQQCWENLHLFRLKRARNKRYTYGDQWEDFIEVDGVRMKEREYILQQGSIPFKNNFIHRTLRNVVGIYRKQSKEPTCVARDREEQSLGETMSTVLQYNGQLNQLQDLHARSLNEFLMSGLVVHRKWFGWRNDKCDCWTDYVQPDNFFVDNNMRDFRGWDVSVVGELHDVSFDALCGQFAMAPSDVQYLRDLYTIAGQRQGFINSWHQFGMRDDIDVSFFVPRDESRCRVIELWRKESKPRYQCHDLLNGYYYKVEEGDYAAMVEEENASRLRQGRSEGLSDDEIPLIESRWFMDEYWYYYYLTPLGDILAEGESPYEHRSHPYVFKLYPFIDGEVHAFVEDFIDQQRYINRMVSLFEWVIRSSAKGVLLVPEECIPDDSSLEEIADTWSRFDGVVAIKAKPGVPLPQQISSNSTNIGIMEMLNLQIKFFEDISGVNGALQGKQGFSGQSAALYAQQAQNASTSLVDVLDTYSSFVLDGAIKDVKNIQQFYDTKRYVNIAGKSGGTIVYDPQKIRDVEFDLSVIESTSTPAYRQIANDFLMQIWSSGQITLEQLLEVGDFPFGDRLMQSVQANAERIRQGENIAPMDGGLVQQMQGGANMQAVNQAREMMMQ